MCTATAQTHDKEVATNADESNIFDNTKQANFGSSTTIKYHLTPKKFSIIHLLKLQKI